MAEEIKEGAYLYLQRKGDDAGVSTKTWGIMVTSMPMLTKLETKDPEANDWKDEDGEDVYDNGTVRIKAFDFEVGLVYVGTMAGYVSSMSRMTSYLTSKRLFSLYSPHTENGKHSCYLKEMDGATTAETGNPDAPYCFKWNMKCRCVDPASTVEYHQVGTTITLN